MKPTHRGSTDLGSSAYIVNPTLLLPNIAADKR
jgi:hypothetical protein